MIFGVRIWYYFFPQGYDARYWQAFANATSRSARYEDFVLDGRASGEKVTLSPVAEYAKPCAYVTKFMPKYENVSPLQHVAYDKDGVRVVAVFNFWDRGDAFFALKTEMPAGNYAIVDDAGVGYAKDLSAADLERGVLLTVGATRTKVFELRPAESAEGVTWLAAGQVERLYAAKKGDIAAAAAEDAAIEASTKVTVDSKSEL